MPAIGALIIVWSISKSIGLATYRPFPGVVPATHCHHRSAPSGTPRVYARGGAPACSAAPAPRARHDGHADIAQLQIGHDLENCDEAFMSIVRQRSHRSRDW